MMSSESKYRILGYRLENICKLSCAKQIVKSEEGCKMCDDLVEHIKTTKDLIINTVADLRELDMMPSTQLQKICTTVCSGNTEEDKQDCNLCRDLNNTINSYKNGVDKDDMDKRKEIFDRLYDCKVLQKYKEGDFDVYTKHYRSSGYEYEPY